ncbi:MAG: hypothetical protein HUJ61_01600 [Bacilli bacterium]|nr:hypothetical protein [Bacilli bacterium]
MKKKNNGNQLQPYDQDSGKYLEKNANVGAYDNDFINMINRKRGVKRSQSPVHFPKIEIHTDEYIQDYLDYEVDWNSAEIPPGKISKYLFNLEQYYSHANFVVNILGFNEKNASELVRQILFGAVNYKAFFKKIDEHGIHAYIIMPIRGIDGTFHPVLTAWTIIDYNDVRLSSLYKYKKGDEQIIWKNTKNMTK